MGTGEIVDFTKPNMGKKPVELPSRVERRSALTGDENVQIRLHEEIIVQGQEKIRNEPKKEGDAEVRLRISDRAGWNRILLDEDDD